MTPTPIHTIVIYSRPHADTIAAIFLLRYFGNQHFPGIENATVEFWNTVKAGKTIDEWEEAGYVLVDMGGGKFDHHQEDHTAKKDCASTLIARYLGIDTDPALKRLLQYVKRDDLEGRGIVSKDVIDRAFGLSAIIMNLNRDYPDHPEYVVDIVSRIYLAHYHEQYRRLVLMPQEWAELQATGKATRFDITAAARTLHVAMVESDSKALVGFLRAIKEVQADIVVQRRSSGHINIVTRQTSERIDLRPAIALLRAAEARKQGRTITHEQQELEKPGRLASVPEWYFDTAATTLQNGGADTTGIEPTQLTLANIQAILTKTLAAPMA